MTSWASLKKYAHRKEAKCAYMGKIWWEACQQKDVIWWKKREKEVDHPTIMCVKSMQRFENMICKKLSIRLKAMKCEDEYEWTKVTISHLSHILCKTWSMQLLKMIYNTLSPLLSVSIIMIEQEGNKLRYRQTISQTWWRWGR